MKNRKPIYILLTEDYHKIGQYTDRKDAFAYADWLDGNNIIETVYDDNDTEWELD